ncbi:MULTISPECIES: DUF4160 domain-containing protein [Gallibacterium]|uniref:DUF4160 domain-containing protein n=1 Tax=Gallibacterium TaxID=155493 RepID=UPI000531689D|nr:MULTISPECIES: DUF4160 domain-containing protein [Gallibacterium]KGQ32719.1 hypothetical protein JP34_09115 [Gallibacterium anatis]KGQ61161.1 hypothetical protein IO43_11275 [Gallibacterium anatis 7990]KGQ66120.1 hypothetical protein IO49_06420 [Gallibacterium anatis]MDA3978077.1 DUF4160 domain-containing protein [Gallibacterium sp. AGMB14963]
MPIVLTYKGYRIYFYSNEGEPLEHIHVHVRKADKKAKIWLNPISVANNYGFSTKEMKELLNYIARCEPYIIGVWNEFFKTGSSH